MPLGDVGALAVSHRWQNAVAETWASTLNSADPHSVISEQLLP